MQQPYGQPPPQQYQQPPPQKKGTSPLVIVLAVIGGMMVLGFGGCVLCVGVGAKGVADEHAKQSQAKTEAKKAAKADKLEVTAVVILATYKANEVKGDNLYKGKYVEVLGKVDTIGKDLLDNTYVTLSGGGEQYAVEHVQCTFAKGAGNAAGDLSKGQLVTLAGHVTGKMMNVQMEDCEIVK